MLALQRFLHGFNASSSQAGRPTKVFYRRKEIYIIMCQEQDNCFEIYTDSIF